jgi:predicted  nucleic acid-binding Zn-ribbon protein
MADLEGARKTIVPEVPPEPLAAYERVLEIREGLALVPVVGDACGGCNRRLPPQIVNEALLKAKLVTCESCNRILYAT